MTASKGLILGDELRDVIVGGIQELFSNTFSARPEPKPYFITSEYAGGDADVSGCIGMIQDRHEGIMTIGFPQKLILSIMSRVYRQEFTELDQSVCQGVGEITNISYSLARQGLNRRGYNLRMSLPQVIVGSKHQLHHLHHGKTMVIPFEMEGDSFVVYVTLQESNDAGEEGSDTSPVIEQ